MTVAETETEGDFKLYAIEKYHPHKEPFYYRTSLGLRPLIDLCDFNLREWLSVSLGL